MVGIVDNDKIDVITRGPAPGISWTVPGPGCVYDPTTPNDPKVKASFVVSLGSYAFIEQSHLELASLLFKSSTKEKPRRH